MLLIQNRLRNIINTRLYENVPKVIFLLTILSILITYGLLIFYYHNLLFKNLSIVFPKSMITGRHQFEGLLTLFSTEIVAFFDIL